ncbi:YeeE/YedE family protein [Seohaeicola nanhaiensis]|uniref:YeeE/YedE family protein n=1 Tax=Seohaeicola nanhaiensis TaxID=1387282 RepID=A0ABV9KA33_9RHOB
MMAWASETQLVAAVGLFGGVLLGLAARLGRFCSLGAIEDALYGGSDIRLRMWALAVGASVIGTFALIGAGLLEGGASYYLSIRWMPVAAVVGGLMFGYGMALAGNCGYGAIARLGGGDLRSFVVVLVMGVSAYAVLAGPFAPLRDLLFHQEPETNGILPGLAHQLAGLVHLPVAGVGIAVGIGICVLALWSRAFRRDGRAVAWSLVVAVAIVSGWAGTAWVQAHGFAATPVVSHSFSAPVGETILFAMTGSARPLSFAVGSVAGVWLGAFAGSLMQGRFRWEACEDPRELRRQIIGAAIMGAGAVIALGCTVGQGLSAMSVLALSAPLTICAIFAGAALGLRQLIEGFRLAE